MIYRIFLLFFISFCAIIAIIYLVSPYKIADDLTIMSTEVWGQLPKAQDNSDTIDDAIAAAIAAHESDPESHLGEGESLEAHRAFGVLDHPPGSVVADKTSSSELIWENFFTDLSIWFDYGSIIAMDGGGVNLDTYDPGNIARLYGAPFDQNIVLNFSKDFIFDSTVNLQVDDNNGGMLLGSTSIMSDDTSLVPTTGVYFYVTGKTVLGRVRYSGVNYDTSTFALPDYEFVKLRYFWEASTKTAYFYVNGVLLGSVVVSSATGSIQYSLQAKVVKNTTSNVYSLGLVHVAFSYYFSPLF